MKIIKDFSVRQDGNMKIYLGADHIADNENKTNKKNRKLFLQKVGLNDTDLVLAGLVHGNKIVAVGGKDKGKVIPKCDGFVTDVSGIILGVTAADCLPIYFWDKKKNVIGLAHAGWRGVQSKIVGEMVKIFMNKYGCRAEDIEAEIGPHIKDCHFEVKDDVVKNFSGHSEHIKIAAYKKYLNLGGIVKKQLLASGLKEKNITETNECTFCRSDKYFSYRRDKPKDIEAMLAYITI
jgi:YfiH family protein